MVRSQCELVGELKKLLTKWAGNGVQVNTTKIVRIKDLIAEKWPRNSKSFLSEKIAFSTDPDPGNRSGSLAGAD